MAHSTPHEPALQAIAQEQLRQSCMICQIYWMLIWTNHYRLLQGAVRTRAA